MTNDMRNSNYSRSIFYRGISLKEYLRKSSIFHKKLEYPDDQTILLDEDRSPVIINDDFIITEPAQIRPQHTHRGSLHSREKTVPGQKSEIELPSLKRNGKLKINTHCNITERNSTDDSTGSSFDFKLSQLPDINQKDAVSGDNNFLSSQAHNKSVSRRKKATETGKELEQVEQEVPAKRQKPHMTREYTECIKKEMMLKHRYNIHKHTKAANDKVRDFKRVKSFAQQ